MVTTPPCGSQGDGRDGGRGEEEEEVSVAVIKQYPPSHYRCTNYVLCTRRIHGEPTATASVREEEDVVVLLSFVWVPSDDHYSLHRIQY